MKFILALLAVAAYAVGIDAQCSIQGFCAKEGERCDNPHYNFTNPATTEVNCEYGTYCNTGKNNELIYPVCTALSGLGEVCGTSYSQCAPPYICYDGPGNGPSTCQMQNYLGYGESCDSDFQCGNNLPCEDGKCQLKPNVVCQPGQCPYGQWCNGTTAYNVPTQCVDWKAKSDSCQRDEQCPYDYYCGYQNVVAFNMGNEGLTCQPIFGKSAATADEDNVCTQQGLNGAAINPFSLVRPQCAAGSWCSGGKCIAIEAVPSGTCGNVAGAVNCNPIDPINNPTSTCACESTSSEIGTCTPFAVDFSTACQSSVEKIVACAKENECPSINFISMGPKSCIIEHCSSDLCENDCTVTPKTTCGDAPANPICKVPSSSSIVLPSFVMLIVAIIALLF